MFRYGTKLTECSGETLFCLLWNIMRQSRQRIRKNSDFDGHFASFKTHVGIELCHFVFLSHNMLCLCFWVGVWECSRLLFVAPKHNQKHNLHSSQHPECSVNCGLQTWTRTPGKCASKKTWKHCEIENHMFSKLQTWCWWRCLVCCTRPPTTCGFASGHQAWHHACVQPRKCNPVTFGCFPKELWRGLLETETPLFGSHGSPVFASQMPLCLLHTRAQTQRSKAVRRHADKYAFCIWAICSSGGLAMSTFGIAWRSTGPSRGWIVWGKWSDSRYGCFAAVSFWSSIGEGSGLQHGFLFSRCKVFSQGCFVVELARRAMRGAMFVLCTSRLKSCTCCLHLDAFGAQWIHSCMWQTSPVWPFMCCGHLRSQLPWWPNVGGPPCLRDLRSSLPILMDWNKIIVSGFACKVGKCDWVAALVSTHYMFSSQQKNRRFRGCGPVYNIHKRAC